MGRKKLRNLQRLQLAYSQNWKCNICKEHLPPMFEIDHIVPLCLNGSNNIQNLQCLCAKCHNIKTTNDINKLYDIKESYQRKSKYWNPFAKEYMFK